MTDAAPSVPLVASVGPSQANINTGFAMKSSPKFSARQDKREYRRSFASKWQQFMLNEFESPAHAAFEFGCDPGTAEGWFEGSHAPSGPFVGYAYSRWPERVSNYLRGVFA